MSNAPGPTKQSDVDICQSILLNIGYDFRLNILTDRIEVTGKKNRILDDKFFKVIGAEVGRKFRISSERLDIAITEMAWRHSYHPIKDYLNSLSYDGGPHFQNLINCFDNPDGLFPIWLRKWLLGAVAKVFAQEQNPMLVLSGPQGIGKSKFVEWLCGKVHDYFIESSINTNDKDSFDMLASTWIWEVSELGSSLKRSDLEALKHFITMANITIRPAYGKYSITRPALASMVGTVNDRGGGLFDDPTGSRRFLICEIKSIDWKEYTRIDIDQLWAEIYVSYLAGETWKLTEDESKRQYEKNLEYQPKDSLEDCLVDGFDIDLSKKADPTYFTPVTVILEYLQEVKNFKAGSTMALNKMLAQTCKSLGLEPGREMVRSITIGLPDKRVRGYKGIRKQ